MNMIVFNIYNSRTVCLIAVCISSLFASNSLSQAVLSSTYSRLSKLSSDLLPTASNTSNNITLACLMIVRDEAENLQKHLPLWTHHQFCNAFVIAIDSRTIDSTHQILTQTIPSNIPHHIYISNFTNFGQARTNVLQQAYLYYANMTHIFMMDPDWKPNITSLDKSNLSLDIEAYQFKIWDRSGVSIRYANWLALHQPNLTFAYYVHEDFRLPNGFPPFRAKKLQWEVYEIEPEISWHTHVGHGHDSTASRSHQRYYFDLNLLQQEQQDPKYKNSIHTLFYLGLVHCALMEGSEDYQPIYNYPNATFTLEMRHHLSLHIEYLERLIRLHYDSIFQEYVYLTLRWLAYAHHYLLLQPKKAKYYYYQCISYDPERVDCKIELGKLLTFEQNHDTAWEWSKRAFMTMEPTKAWTHTYMYDCSTPLQLARSSLNKIISSNYDEFCHQRYAIGYMALMKAKTKCKMLVFEDLDIFEQMEKGYRMVLNEIGQKYKKRWEDVCQEDDQYQFQNHPECDLFRLFDHERMALRENIGMYL